MGRDCRRLLGQAAAVLASGGGHKPKVVRFRYQHRDLKKIKI
jgi:hypothetical protein